MDATTEPTMEEEQQAAADAPKLTLPERISALVAGTQKLATESKALGERLAAAEAQLAQLTEENENLRAARDEATETISALSTTVTNLEAAARTVEAAAAEKVAALGIPQGDLPEVDAAEDGPASDSRFRELETYEAMEKGEAKATYFSAHKKKILAQQALRDAN